MNNAAACLKHAAECTRLAEATSDPEMKVYLLKLEHFPLMLIHNLRVARN